MSIVPFFFLSLAGCFFMLAGYVFGKSAYQQKPAPQKVFGLREAEEAAAKLGGINKETAKVMRVVAAVNGLDNQVLAHAADEREYHSRQIAESEKRISDKRRQIAIHEGIIENHKIRDEDVASLQAVFAEETAAE
ncbi:MAG: hypothetical protein KGI50_00540 [Patescibacteria group bacterium]|nr:hypothetical protein [Patescibacteria group bacterium]MDE2438156.1 hypothetical protein [Patescibacteria group bacterium]